MINVVEWYGAVNLFVFLFYGIDKWKAVHHRWRISESMLLGAAVFGVFGALLGMLFWHHKTKKPKFYLGVPAIMILEAAALALYFYMQR